MKHIHDRLCDCCVTSAFGFSSSIDSLYFFSFSLQKFEPFGAFRRSFKKFANKLRKTEKNTQPKFTKESVSGKSK